MARAYGSSAHLLMKRETIYGEAATGNYIRIPFNRCNLGSEQGLIDDPVLGQGRDPLRIVQDACLAVLEGHFSGLHPRFRTDQCLDGPGTAVTMHALYFEGRGVHAIALLSKWDAERIGAMGPSWNCADRSVLVTLGAGSGCCSTVASKDTLRTRVRSQEAERSAAWSSRFVGTNWWRCLTVIPMLSVAPLAFTLRALRWGAPTRGLA